jgi:hypothetical protein
VTGAQLVRQGGEKSKKPVLFFEGKDKGLIVNATNAKVIERLYGAHVEQWVGKRIALYVTQTSVGGEQMDCIRVRPVAPPVAKQAEREPGTDE